MDACDLFRRCVARRDDDDWREFIRRYGRRVRAIVRSHLVRQGLFPFDEDVDEHVQELYLRLLLFDRRGFQGTSEREVFQYLERAASNLAIDRRRAVDRRPRAPDPTCPGVGRLPSTEPSPERHAMGRQGLELFLERCRMAAAGFRVELKLRVLRLALFEGLTSREIARELSDRVTPGQVDSMLFRLRRRLAEQGSEVPGRRPCPVAAAP